MIQSEIDIILKLLIALAVGALIGLERELRRTQAGLRTHALVCMASALFTLLSISFDEDPARIAAGVVTGIGFFGAGVIFRSENRIIGLTTAADLWVIGAIGLAVGLGYYLAAFVATFLVLFLLESGRMLEVKALHEKDKEY